MDERLVRLIEAVLSEISGHRVATRTAQRLAAEIVGDGYSRTKDMEAQANE